MPQGDMRECQHDPPCGSEFCSPCTIIRLERELKAHDDADKSRRVLVRQLDVAINGEDAAAKQASLCDIVLQVITHFEELKRVFPMYPTVKDWEIVRKMVGDRAAAEYKTHLDDDDMDISVVEIAPNSEIWLTIDAKGNGKLRVGKDWYTFEEIIEAIGLKMKNSQSLDEFEKRRLRALELAKNPKW